MSQVRPQLVRHVSPQTVCLCMCPARNATFPHRTINGRKDQLTNASQRTCLVLGDAVEPLVVALHAERATVVADIAGKYNCCQVWRTPGTVLSHFLFSFPFTQHVLLASCSAPHKGESTHARRRQIWADNARMLSRDRALRVVILVHAHWTTHASELQRLLQQLRLHPLPNARSWSATYTHQPTSQARRFAGRKLRSGRKQGRRPHNRSRSDRKRQESSTAAAAPAARTKDTSIVAKGRPLCCSTVILYWSRPQRKLWHVSTGARERG